MRWLHFLPHLRVLQFVRVCGALALGLAIALAVFGGDLSGAGWGFFWICGSCVSMLIGVRRAE